MKRMYAFPPALTSWGDSSSQGITMIRAMDGEPFVHVLVMRLWLNGWVLLNRRRALASPPSLHGENCGELDKWRTRSAPGKDDDSCDDRCRQQTNREIAE